MRLLTHRREPARALPPQTTGPAPDVGAIPIAEVEWRRRARVAGRVRSVRIQPWGDAPTLECTLVDATGGLAVVFLGRRQVAGVRPGCHLVAEGVVGAHDGRLAILNPVYELLPPGA
jgi:hypothetical protein